jgi:hypothetical protein
LVAAILRAAGSSLRAAAVPWREPLTVDLAEALAGDFGAGDLGVGFDFGILSSSLGVKLQSQRKRTRDADCRSLPAHRRSTIFPMRTIGEFDENGLPNEKGARFIYAV